MTTDQLQRAESSTLPGEAEPNPPAGAEAPLSSALNPGQSELLAVAAPPAQTALFPAAQEPEGTFPVAAAENVSPVAAIAGPGTLPAAEVAAAAASVPEAEPTTVLGKVRRLLRDKTRFEPEDVLPVDETDVRQKFLVRVLHALDAQVEFREINGFFQRGAQDNKTATPQRDAVRECDARLQLGAAHLRNFLQLPETTYRALEAGCILPHATKHWYLHTCGTCDGDGSVICHTCHGRKEETCWKCSGGLFVTCDGGCHGGGTTMCHSCSGSGQVATQVAYQVTNTTWVNGVAHYDYSTQYRTEYRHCTAFGCVAGRIQCSRCTGTGRVRCDVCNATGKITCRTCSGRGRLTCTPCAGSGKVGHAAWVDVMDAPSYHLAWPEDADRDAAGIGEREGPHGVVDLTDGVALQDLAEDRPAAPKLLTADYQGELAIFHLTAACNGKDYRLTAYGKDRRWLTLDGIVEDLLRRDLASLQTALNEAADEDFTSSRLDHLLTPLKHVAASELNAELVEAALAGGEGASTPYDTIVTADYAKQVKTGILGSLRFIYNRLALQFWWKAAAAGAGLGLLAWLFFGKWAAALAALATVPGAAYLFKRKVAAVLSEALGGEAHALRAMAIASKGKRNRISAALVMGPTISLAVLAALVLPVTGPWSSPAKTTVRTPVKAAAPAGNGQAETAAATVGDALALRSQKRKDEARSVLQKLSAAGDAAAVGPYAWMVMMQEGAGNPGQSRESEYEEARRWADQALARNPDDLWATATRGVLLNEGWGTPRNTPEGMRLLKKAALAGHVESIHILGQVYLHGFNIPVNAVEARKWFTMAADTGRAADIYNVGLMDWYGWGGKQDRDKARRLWKQAAELGDQRAIKAVALGHPPD